MILQGPEFRARLLCAWVSCALGCDTEDTNTASPVDPPETLRAGLVHYELAVDWSGAVREDDSYVFINDLGYEIRISSWVQSSTSIELASCEALRAHAFESDPSVVGHEVSEELTEGSPTYLGSGEGTDEAYCAVYQILGRLPAGDEPEVVSWIEGSYRVPGQEEAVEFSALNPVPISVLPSLATGSWHAQLENDEAWVQLNRYPARTFDGMELAEMSELDVAFEAAQDLAQSAEVRWWLGEN